MPTPPARLARSLAMCLTAALTLVATAAVAEPVRGAGSTFVAPLIERWQQRFRVEQTDGFDQLSVDLGVDYEPVGSLAGVMRATQLGMDFGATDRPLTPEELARLGLGQFPIVVGGIAVVVAVDGVRPGAMNLTAPVIADIYLGGIKTWNDPAIGALNPELTLPAAPINVVHRSDGSGTTFNLADFLARHSEPWRATMGVDTVLRWPVGAGVEKNEGVAQAVKSTPNSIGYVEAGLVARLGMADARVQNSAGAFVRPDAAALSAAAASADWANAREFDLRLTDAPGEGAYPIVATVFVVTPKQASTPARRAAFQFFRHSLREGAQDALDLGYVPLPPAVVEQVERYWATDLAGSDG